MVGIVRGEVFAENFKVAFRSFGEIPWTNALVQDN
jgi:hypothetical protein